MRTTWPDMTAEPPPVGDAWASAAWLLSRHAMLAQLADRVGVTRTDPDDPLPDLDLDLLAEGIRAHDEHSAAWARYEREHPLGRAVDDDQYERWRQAGPTLPDTEAGRVARAFGPMSSGEKRRLRLLAFFAPGGTRIAPDTFDGLDDDGRATVRDWLDAVAAYVALDRT